MKWGTGMKHSQTKVGSDNKIRRNVNQMKYESSTYESRLWPDMQYCKILLMSNF